MNKKLIVGVVAIEEHDLTLTTLQITAGSTTPFPKDIQFVIVDNASKKPYKIIKGGGLITVLRNKENRGAFYPLRQLYEKYPDAEVIGIMHNDCAIYEPQWDKKILEMFKKDKKLGAVGVFGWEGVDKYGVDFNPIGNPNEKVKQTKYRRVKKLTPAATLDSMCIFFRANLIPLLDIQEDILLRHGYDKIWALWLIKAGYKVGVSGFSFQHKGMAAFGKPEYLATMKKWFDKRWNANFPPDSVEGIMLFESRVLLVNEFKSALPCKIKNNYKL